MIHEDIIRMAREAGIHHAHDSEGHWDGLTDEEVIDRLPRFRQKDEYADKRIVEILGRFAALIAVAEREACAKVCETYDHADPLGVSAECAVAIRARGQK